MDLGGVIAHYEDLRRLKRLERAGYFKPGFAAEARNAVLRYLVRMFELRAVFCLIPYPGPTILEHGE